MIKLKGNLKHTFNAEYLYDVIAERIMSINIQYGTNKSFYLLLYVQSDPREIYVLLSKLWP